MNKLINRTPNELPIYYIVYGYINGQDNVESSGTLTDWDLALQWFDRFKYCDYVFINRTILGHPDLVVKRRGT